MKITDYPRVRWLLETPPRMRASRTETIARARIQVRFQLELELWLEFVSKFELIGIRNRIEKLLENGCLSWLQFDCKSFENNSKLNWLRLQKFRKQFEKMKGLISQLNADDLTRHWAKARRIFDDS